jgi:hypothetical protein
MVYHRSVMSYDDLLRQAREVYTGVTAAADQEVEAIEEMIRSLEAQISAKRAVKAQAEQEYHATLISLAERRLAGEFTDAATTKTKESARPVRGELEEAVEAAAKLAFDDNEMTATQINEAYGIINEAPLNRSTLNGALNRLVEQGKLIVVEQGFKRRPTRYAIVKDLELKKEVS